MHTNPAREARRGDVGPFVNKNTKEIQANPAREARRGDFWTLFMKNTKEIQTNPAREARRANFGDFPLEVLKNCKIRGNR